MEINYLSGNTIYFKTKKEKVLVNPTDDVLAKKSARIVIYTDKAESPFTQTEESVKIMGPGEYEVGGIDISGINAGSGSTIYMIKADGIALGIIGEVKEMLSDKKSEKMEGLDIVIFDGNLITKFGAKTILTLAKKWGANILIPVGFKNDVDKTKLLDEADAEGQQEMDTFKVDKENLPENLEVVILKETK